MVIKSLHQHNEVVRFAGNSFLGVVRTGRRNILQSSVVSWLKKDWRTTIVRAAMEVEDAGEYISNPEGNKTRLKAVVDAAIAESLYAIIGWHSHHTENYTEQAVACFEEMAGQYSEYDNVIYERYNEALQVSWSSTVKPYAETVITAIRV